MQASLYMYNTEILLVEKALRIQNILITISISQYNIECSFSTQKNPLPLLKAYVDKCCEFVFISISHILLLFYFSLTYT